MNFSSSSFLHHQVRNMVGTLVLVGEGKIKADDLKIILESQDRTKSGPNAPAQGLYFLGGLLMADKIFSSITPRQ